jgi:hypothetical protein
MLVKPDRRKDAAVGLFRGRVGEACAAGELPETVHKNATTHTN